MFVFASATGANPLSPLNKGYVIWPKLLPLYIKARKQPYMDRVGLHNIHTLGPQEEEILHRGPFYFDAVLNDWMEDFFFHVYSCCSEEFCQVLHSLWNCFWRRGKVICIDPLGFAFCSWQHKQNSKFQTQCKLCIDLQRRTPRAKFNKSNNVIFFYTRSYIIIIVAQITKSKRFLHHISCVMKDTQ